MEQNENNTMGNQEILEERRDDRREDRVEEREEKEERLEDRREANKFIIKALDSLTTDFKAYTLKMEPFINKVTTHDTQLDFIKKFSLFFVSTIVGALGLFVTLMIGWVNSILAQVNAVLVHLAK